MRRYRMIAVVVSAAVLAGCSEDGSGTRTGMDAPVDGSETGSALTDARGDGVGSNGDVLPPPEPVRSFYTNFEAPVPAQVNTGDCQLKPTQGYASLGGPNNTFAGTFLWCPVQKRIVVTLLYLAPHSSLDISFLLAAIDSLDGTANDGTGDFFTVSLDGRTLFRESFANTFFIEAATGQITNAFQSYLPGPGVELARRVDLGFAKGTYWLDSAYNMGLDAAFSHIPHSSSTATIVFTLSNDHTMAFDDDESWAIDNIRVTVGDTPRSTADGGADAASDAAAGDAR